MDVKIIISNLALDKYCPFVLIEDGKFIVKHSMLHVFVGDFGEAS